MKFATLGVLCLMFCAYAQGQNVRQTFQNPPKAYRPMVRWWWPGGDVTDAELRREIGLLDRANFGGAEIQPFLIGLKPNMPEETRQRVDDYLTPAFFGHVRAALEEAQSRGMWLDYTFGSGWPFGGAGVITPELASVELRFAHRTIRGPVKFHSQLLMPELDPSIIDKIANLPAGWAAQFKQREKLVAVVAVRGESAHFYQSPPVGAEAWVRKTGQLDPGTSIVLTNHVSADGTLDWDVPPGTWQLFTFKELPTGEKVAGGVGAGTQLVLDHMDRRAFDIYAQKVGGTARQYDGQFFGHGMRAIFCDSLEVFAYLYWDDHFLEEFRQRRGYDLTPYLPLLKIQGAGLPYGANGENRPLYDMHGVGDRVRRDYWQTVSDVMFDNFYQPFNQWAAHNNLLSRVQAHGSPTDLLRVYGAADIPETEDLYDNGRYDFLKMASSGADLYGRKIVASESFVWKGRVYQTTPEKIKRYADELLTAGINEIIYHGYPYRYMDRPFPGWHPFAMGGAFSSDMNETNPFTPYLPELNEYITRLQYISQIGRTVAPVALYREKLAYDAIDPPPPEPEIDTRLMQAGYNFDHIDAWVLLHCHVDGGRLISPGGESYSVLVLPEQKTVSRKLADQLLTFSRQELPIVFVGRVPLVEPEVSDGRLQGAPANDSLRGILKAGTVHSADIDGAVGVLNAAGVQPKLHFQATSVPFIEKRIGRLDAFFLRNPDDTEKQVQADFAATGTPELWDPWTGAVEPLANFERRGNRIRVQLSINAYGSKLLVFDPAAKPAERRNEAEPGKMVAQLPVGQNGWKFHGVGIGPSSQPETIDMELPNLIDWSTSDRLRNFSGRGQYTTTFTLPANFLTKRDRIVLDMGDVKDVAEISVDGKTGPVVLLRPYKADLTGLVHAGVNTLQVTVVNTLFNALSARGPSENFSHATIGTANGLMPSGLIGPVRLEEWPAK